MEKPLRCPFCGSTDTVISGKIRHRGKETINKKWCGCRSCGCSGPRMKSGEDALKWWNTRIMTLDLAEYVLTQRLWSKRTFGPGRRTLGIIEHIKKELLEIEAEPLSLEWIDVVILALDGAWRAGHSPTEIATALVEKQRINIERRWPPPGPEDEATEHIREES